MTFELLIALIGVGSFIVGAVVNRWWALVVSLGVLLVSGFNSEIQALGAFFEVSHWYFARLLAGVSAGGVIAGIATRRLVRFLLRRRRRAQAGSD